MITTKGRGKKDSGSHRHGTIAIGALVFRGQWPLKLDNIIMKLCQFVELKGLR